jgi:hypothetical protein
MPPPSRSQGNDVICDFSALSYSYILHITYLYRYITYYITYNTYTVLKYNNIALMPIEKLRKVFASQIKFSWFALRIQL